MNEATAISNGRQSTELTHEDRACWQTRPDERPVMYQSWNQLLFLHWRFEPEAIQRCLPRGLTVDTYDGSAWVAIVPFLMRNIRPCWSPVVPYISNFLELNVRTYAIDEEGVPGVWFLSLSADRLLATMLGRKWFRLPYFTSSMSSRKNSEGYIDYSCRRWADAERRVAKYRYRPTNSLRIAEPDTLEFFLVERYILFADLGSAIATGQVHHTPYQFQSVELEGWDTAPLEIDGLTAPERAPDSALYSPGVDVDIFALKC